MRWLLTAVFFASFFGAFERIEVGNIAFYLHEVFLALFYLLFLMTRFDNLKQSFIKFRKVYVSLSLFLIWEIFTILANYKIAGPFYTFLSFAYLLRFAFYVFSPLFIYSWLKNLNRKRLRSFVRFIFLGIFASSIVQYIFFPDLTLLKYFGWDPHYKRLVGPFLDAYLSASIFGLLAIFSFLLNWISWFFVFALLLVFTYSRAALISFFIVLFYRYLLRQTSEKRISLFKIFLPVLIILFFSFYLNTGIAGNFFRVATIKARIEDSKIGLKLWRENLLFGVGYNRVIMFREANKKVYQKLLSGFYHSRSSFHTPYLTLLVSGGVFGFVLFFFLVREIYKIYSWPEVYLFVGIFSLFDNVLFHPVVLLYFFLILSFLEIYSTD